MAVADVVLGARRLGRCFFDLGLFGGNVVRVIKQDYAVLSAFGACQLLVEVVLHVVKVVVEVNVRNNVVVKVFFVVVGVVIVEDGVLEVVVVEKGVYFLLFDWRRQQRRVFLPAVVEDFVGVETFVGGYKNVAVAVVIAAVNFTIVVVVVFVAVVAVAVVVYCIDSIVVCSMDVVDVVRRYNIFSKIHFISFSKKETRHVFLLTTKPICYYFSVNGVDRRMLTKSVEGFL